MAVREILEEMADLERDMEPIFVGLRETPLGESGRQAFHAVKFLMMAEKKHQKAGRVRALGLDPTLASQHSRDSDRFNDQGLGRLRAATRALEQGKAATDRPTLGQFEEATRSDEFRDELGRARDAVQGHLVKLDFAAVEVGELHGIWAEAFDTLERDGPEGLTRFYEHNLQELASRRAMSDRGRTPRSPILWWKAAAIAVIVGVGVWDIIQCYRKRGCSDVFRNTWDATGICLLILASCPPWDQVKEANVP